MTKKAEKLEELNKAFASWCRVFRRRQAKNSMDDGGWRLYAGSTGFQVGQVSGSGFKPMTERIFSADELLMCLYFAMTSKRGRA